MMDEKEQQRLMRLRGALLLHVFGPDREAGNADRYRSLSDYERRIIGPWVEHDMNHILLSEAGVEARGVGIIAMTQACGDLEPPAESDLLPTPIEIAQRLSVIGGVSCPTRLKARLTDEGWSTSRTELGIQRAIDSGEIELDRDWTMRLPRLRKDTGSRS